MRTLAILIAFVFASAAFKAQDNTIKTITIPVKGNCDECKKRIENSADIKGVKLAVWDEVKQSVTVTYRADKVTPQQIEQAIAAGGHDAGKTKASAAGYARLPDCCKYRDKACEKK